VRIASKYNLYTADKTAKRKNTEYSPNYYGQKNSFNGKLMEVADNSVKFYNINKVINAIDGVIGQEGYLSDKLNKAGLTVSNDILSLKKHTLFGDILSTIKYPFVDMPFDILNALSKTLKKTKFSSLSKTISNFAPIKKGIERVEAKKNYELVENILEKFCEKDTTDIDKLGKIFSKNVTQKITQTAKNYASRDERTLNRFVTGSVGAILSGVDMYNISMLEKNDKTSALKAQKDRREQEMTRIALSSGLTFLSLGALSRYTKNSVFLNAGVIAGSALIAEIYSRVKKHRPLTWLTPEQAKKYAQKNKKAKKTEDSVEAVMKRISKKDKNNLYKDFAYNKAVEAQKTLEADNKNKKKSHIIRNIGLGFIFASTFYAASRFLKGDYFKLMMQKPIYENNKEKIDKYVSGAIDDLGDDILKSISKTEEKLTFKDYIYNKAGQKGKDRIDFIEKYSEKPAKIFNTIRKAVDKIFNDKKLINAEELNRELDAIAKREDAKDLIPLIEEYKKHILIAAKGEKNFECSIKRTIPNAVYSGVTKLFKTFYTLLSAPALAVDKYFFGKTEKAFKELDKMRGFSDSSRFIKDYNKEASELYSLFNDKNKSFIQKVSQRIDNLFKKQKSGVDKYQKAIQTIRNCTRNFEAGSETSDLANWSRAMVTLISSYFYVNDFRNTVLIESEGKDTQRAQEVANDSIGFKICNFLFNGTIMNLGNSLFKNLLNRSLIGATAIAAGEEITNEFLIRKTISRPMRKMDSKDSLIEYDKKRMDRKGPFGAWTRFFKKVTGQKSLVEKYEAQHAK